MPSLRLIPIVLIASASLLALKTVALLQNGGYVTPGPQQAAAQSAKRSWAQEMLGYPEHTGSIDEAKPLQPEQKPAPTEGEKTAPVKGRAATPDSIGTSGPVVLDGAPKQSPGERAVLESLQERRKELDARARELDIREGLLKAAEKRLEARLQELKEKEAEIKSSLEKKHEVDAESFKSLVTMYENMKAKDAARIFDRLEMSILLEVASHINPRRMADILAQMAPEAAERLTVELASRAQGSRADARSKTPNPLDLPKIEGKPRG
ncbi:MAG TPA: flagellar protein FlbB [Xanthobacteraceae bacterium]|nr:flagellar protein FlbB [Xanthobacteraceae bacterium]